MEPPVRSDSESIRDEKVKVLKAVPPIEEKNLVRGQFCGYRNENGVAKDSQTETFAAVKLEVNSWRWKGVPFYIRAGKCLPARPIPKLSVSFRKPPTLVPDSLLVENHLRLRLESGHYDRDGDDGPNAKLRRICASDRRNGGQPLSSCGRNGCVRTCALGAAMAGDSTLFAREDYVEQAWRVVGPVLTSNTPVYEYAPGTWGPEQAARVGPPAGWSRS